MNGRNAKLLRKMRSNDKASKQLWTSLSAEMKHRVRTHVEALAKPHGDLRQAPVPLLRTVLLRVIRPRDIG